MWFTHSQWVETPRPTPAQVALYAVGDIHGCADELQAMQTVLSRQILGAPSWHHQVIYLGDYIDRGPEIKRTLQLLCTGLGGVAHETHLIGNHEQCLIELLALDDELDREFIESWYDNGGMDTMISLDVEGYGRLVEQDNLAELQARTRAALGPDLQLFLRKLKPYTLIGQYLFVHAGIDPGKSLEQQDFADLLLIRKPFLKPAEPWTHPFTVVHGHSIAMPSVHLHRISVDAGCFCNKALCAVQIQDGRLRFIAVASEMADLGNSKLAGEGSVWQWSPPEPIV